jgi:hypothetical protein
VLEKKKDGEEERKRALCTRRGAKARDHDASARLSVLQAREVAMVCNVHVHISKGKSVPEHRTHQTTPFRPLLDEDGQNMVVKPSHRGFNGMLSCKNLEKLPTCREEHQR